MVFLEISQISQENTCARASQSLRPATLSKKTLAQVFSCEFCEISKNTFFYKTPLVGASALRSFIIQNNIHTVKFTNNIWKQ